MLCSLFGGLALANAKLGAVHGLAAPIGGQFAGPHGAVCARLPPLVMLANEAALRARAPDSPILLRFVDIARVLTGVATASTADGIAFVEQLGQSGHTHDRRAEPNLGARAVGLKGPFSNCFAASSVE